MTHQFDTEIAKLVGVEAATIYQNIQFWCDKNTANDKNIHDGKAWTYNSKQAFLELFPYLSERKIKTALDTLKTSGLIEVRNDLNENKMDHTNWYHAVSKVAEIGRPIDETKTYQSISTNPSNRTDENVPLYTRVSTTPNNKHTDSKHLPHTPKSSSLIIPDSSINQTLVQSFIDHRKEIKKPFTQKALDLFTSKLEKLYHEGYDIETMVNDSIIAGYQSVFPNPRHKQQNGAMVPANKQPWQIEKDRQLALKHSTEAMFEAGLTIFDVLKQRA